MASNSLLLLLACAGLVQASEFVDEVSGNVLPLDPAGRSAWATMTGDGEATMRFTQGDGVGLIEVDARADRRNIWWAVIRRSISAHIDGTLLAKPGMELRVEAKIRVSHAPRRVNLHFNHSRTTDFHSHLMEYDIPDSDGWRVISLTTDGFDATPEDEVFVQMALMDWGREQYRVAVDYLKVGVVDPVAVGQDLGEPLAYRPGIPALGTFAHQREAIKVAPSSWWRWDLLEFAGCTPGGWGALSLDVDGEARELRVVEVLDNGLINGQMLVDVPTAQEGATLAAISPPVLRRLLDGRTKGLAVRGMNEETVLHRQPPVLYLNFEQPCAAAGS